MVGSWKMRFPFRMACFQGRPAVSFRDVFFFFGSFPFPRVGGTKGFFGDLKILAPFFLNIFRLEQTVRQGLSSKILGLSFFGGRNHPNHSTRVCRCFSYLFLMWFLDKRLIRNGSKCACFSVTLRCYQMLGSVLYLYQSCWPHPQTKGVGYLL